MFLYYPVTNGSTKHSNDFRVWDPSLGALQVSLPGVTCFIVAFSLVLNIEEFRVYVFWHYIVIFVPLEGLWCLMQTDL